MTSASVELQDAIIALLKGNAAVTALVGDRIADNAGEMTYPMITIGPSDAIDDDSDCIIGRIETVQVDVWTSGDARKWPCREIVDAAKGALHRKSPDLGTNALVLMSVTMMRVMEDPAPGYVHGILHVEAIVEEADDD